MIPQRERFALYGDGPRSYREAILNTLIELMPKHCLEIGTHKFQSSLVFSIFFQNRLQDGKLITCDITKHNDVFHPPNVYQVMVYPHTNNVRSQHGDIDIHYKDFSEVIDKGFDTVDLNILCLSKVMADLDIDRFDFCFIDGDHMTYSFISDIYICKKLVKPEGYILLDDINDSNHELKYIYYKYLRPKNNFYEFQDWGNNVGMGLIKCGDLIL